MSSRRKSSCFWLNRSGKLKGSGSMSVRHHITFVKPQARTAGTQRILMSRLEKFHCSRPSCQYWEQIYKLDSMSVALRAWGHQVASAKYSTTWHFHIILLGEAVVVVLNLWCIQLLHCLTVLVIKGRSNIVAAACSLFLSSVKAAWSLSMTLIQQGQPRQSNMYSQDMNSFLAPCLLIAFLNGHTSLSYYCGDATRWTHKKISWINIAEMRTLIQKEATISFSSIRQQHGCRRVA